MSQAIFEVVYVQKGLNEMYQAMDALGQLSDENKAKFKTAFDNYNKAVSEATLNTNEQAAATKNLGQQMKGVGDAVTGGALKEFTDEVKKYGDELNKTDGKQKSLRAQLRGMKNELAQMAAAGQSGSAAFKKMQVEAAKLEDDLGDLQRKIKNLASDTRLLDGFVEGFSALAGGIAAAQGAAALFGDENEDLQKAILKTQGALALAQGAQQIMNALQKQSALLTLLQEARMIAFNVVMRAAAAVQMAFGVSSQAAMAMATGGISLLIAGVVALAANYKQLTGSTDAQMKKEEEFYDRRKINADIAKQASESAAKEVTSIMLLAKVITDENKPRQQRVAAIEQYNKVAAEGNKIDVTQIENTTELNRLIKQQTDLIMAQAIVEAAKGKLEVAIGENLDAEIAARLEANKAQQKLNDLQQEAMKNNFSPSEYKALQQEAKMAAEMAAINLATITAKNQDKIKELAALIDMYEKMLQGTSETTVEGTKRAATETVAIYRKMADEIVKLTQDVGEQLNEPKFVENITGGALIEQLYARREELKDFMISSAEIIAQTAISIYRTLNEQAFAEEEARIDAMTEKQMEALQKRKDQGLLTEQQYQQGKETIEKVNAAKMRAFRMREWQMEKQAKMTEILMNQAVAMSKALATTGGEPIRFGFQEALILIQTAAAIGLLQAQKMPAFREGTEFVNGMGTGTSDSITAKLSHGERVVPAHINAELHGISNADLPDLIKLKTGIDTLMPRFAHSDAYSQAIKGGEIDYNKLAELFAEKLSRSPKTVINLDKAGFNLYQQQAGSRRNFLNNYYNG